MNFNNFQDLCKEKVVEYFNEKADKTGDLRITKDYVFVV